jgi:hypothetical protein
MGLLSPAIAGVDGGGGPLPPALEGVAPTDQSTVSPEAAAALEAGITCSVTGHGAFIDTPIVVDKARQTIHAYQSLCGDYALTGTVKKATSKKVKASNLNGSVSTSCCESMHIDTLKWKKRLGTGTIVVSFECSGTHRGPFTGSVTCP